MTPQDFVEALCVTVRDPSVSGAIATLTRPPGRKPPADIRGLAEWYATLDAGGREMVRRALELAVDGAVFGFLCVLDGARAIESKPDKGSLMLIHCGSQDRILNDPGGPSLHELYPGRRRGEPADPANGPA